MSHTRVIDNDGVATTVSREMRLRHRSDTPNGLDQCFGGDSMGHWNIGRIHRILDALEAPAISLPIDRETMVAMARVGAPSESTARAYAARGIASMPPLTFVELGDVGSERPQILMVDGHHRMMALWLAGADRVPARVLPAALADDVRIVEMSEVVVFPDLFSLPNRVEIRAAVAA